MQQSRDINATVDRFALDEHFFSPRLRQRCRLCQRLEVGESGLWALPVAMTALVWSAVSDTIGLWVTDLLVGQLLLPAMCAHKASPDSRRLNDRCTQRTAGRSTRTTRPKRHSLEPFELR